MAQSRQGPVCHLRRGLLRSPALPQRPLRGTSTGSRLPFIGKTRATAIIADRRQEFRTNRTRRNVCDLAQRSESEQQTARTPEMTFSFASPAVRTRPVWRSARCDQRMPPMKFDKRKASRVRISFIDVRIANQSVRSSNFLGEIRQYFSLVNLAQRARTAAKAHSSSVLNNQEDCNSSLAGKRSHAQGPATTTG